MKNINKYKMVKIYFLVIFCFMTIIICPAQAIVMQGDTYILNENVQYEYDGPTISSVGSGSVGESSAVITWATDVIADSYVIYDTNSNFSSSKEQGYSAKTSTSHSVTLTGLSDSTTYYFKVRSTRVNGGSTTSSSVQNFTTSASSAEVTTTVSGGGGTLIIDKTDKIAPLISAINISDTASRSVTISWETDENSVSFVEYGTDIRYGNTSGKWDSVSFHEVSISNLSPNTTYHFRVLSSDASGNLATSDDNIFQTITPTEEIEELIKEEELAEEEVSEQSILERFNLIRELAELIPEPEILGSPSIEVTSDGAVINWTSSKQANSIIAFASEENYDSGKEEPYLQLVGDPDNYTLEHRVEILNLKPNTLYNYQIRMKPIIGPTTKSINFIFRTTEEGLIIDNYYIDVLDDGNVRFRWTTNAEADSAVRFTPYRENVLAIDESKTIRDTETSVIHDMVVEDFFPGIFYEIELLSASEEGSVISESLGRFSLGDDLDAPIIMNIRTDSTVFIEQQEKVQTIVSWRTNEPSTSRVYYLEGVHSADRDWANATAPIFSYSKKHTVVINDFKPGTVYSLRIESSDSNGNVELSGVHTFITPRQKQSIFQIIIAIFEELFGWIFFLKPQP